MKGEIKEGTIQVRKAIGNQFVSQQSDMPVREYKTI